MSALNVHDLNTLLQLSVAFNAACIAAFKLGQFGKIAETTINTNSRILHKVSAIASMAITGLNSLEQVKELHVNTAIKEIADKYNRILAEIEKKNKLCESVVAEKYTPLYIAGLSSFCALFGTISLFFILFSKSSEHLAFQIFICLSFLYVLLFIAIKTYLNTRLHKRLEKAKGHKREQAESKSCKLSKLLSVKAALISCICFLALSILVKLLIQKWLPTFTVAYFWAALIEYASAFLSFSSLIVYVVVTYLYNLRRVSFINAYFKPMEEAIKECKEAKEELDTYLKVANKLSVKAES
ncbi:MAG: hypothetical protein LBK18_10495 [Prevotellaceae bacterium]|jgi:hypothetical protein|nr:hypothetical protein [Prevotellaceae bacterium]